MAHVLGARESFSTVNNPQFRLLCSRTRALAQWLDTKGPLSNKYPSLLGLET